LDVIMNYANNQDSYQEQLSALADGELDAAQVQALVSASKADAQLMQTWASYHTLGDALRAHASDGYASRAQTRGAAQPAMVAPAAPVVQTMPPQQAANDSVWRWKLVAGVAALAAVGSVVWSLVGLQGSPAGAQLAQRSSPALVAAAPAAQVPAAVAPTVVAASQEVAPVMIRDPRLDELLAAHKQFGGASALQQPAGFLRNATFTPTGR
jgi:sigma-E factor negative regulatory protein RseA